LGVEPAIPHTILNKTGSKKVQYVVAQYSCLTPELWPLQNASPATQGARGRAHLLEPSDRSNKLKRGRSFIMSIGSVGSVGSVGAAFRAARLLAASLAGLGQMEGLKLLAGVVLPHPTPRHRTGQDRQDACSTVTPAGDRRGNPRRSQHSAKTKQQTKEK